MQGESEVSLLASYQSEVLREISRTRAFGDFCGTCLCSMYNYEISQVFGHPTPTLSWSLDGRDLPDERRPEREHAEEEEVFFWHIFNIVNNIVQ